jgi:hypothetical protein
MADGRTWTCVKEIAEAIDRSQDQGGGMVVLNTQYGDTFSGWCATLAGICSDQKPNAHGPNVHEFWGYDEDSKPWAIQLCLLPH